MAGGEPAGIRLARYTLLSGANASGKSTLLQSLAASRGSGACLITAGGPGAASAVAALSGSRDAEVAAGPLRRAGLRLALPVVVACLTAPPGGLLLLDDPEGFLHPADQGMMARLTCLAAAGGAQVIAATHSDHILNGVRLAAAGGLLPAGDVALHHLYREAGGAPTADSPVVHGDGTLSHWPTGFFDEQERSLGPDRGGAAAATAAPGSRPRAAGP